MQQAPRGETREARLSCRVCLQEIPASEVCCPEAVDYVLYYCGIECYGILQQVAQSVRRTPRD